MGLPRIDKLFEPSEPQAAVKLDVERSWEASIRPRSPDVPVRTVNVPNEPYLPASVVPFRDPDYVRKNVFWNAFARKAKEAEANHARMATALASFRDAEKSPEVEAMEFSVTGSTTDLETLTERQRVPDEAGGTVGEHFDKSGEVRLDENDVEGIEAANREVRKSRRHPVRKAARETDKTNRERTAALHGLSSALSEVRSKCNSFLAVHSKILVYQAVMKSDEERFEISRLQAEASLAKDVVQTVSDVASGIEFARKGEIGDAIDKFGSAIATLVGHMNDGKVEAAEQRLQRLARTIKSETLRGLGFELAASCYAVQSAVAGFEKAQTSLLATYSSRREAYQDLGEAVTTESGSSRAGGAISSLPLIENVVNRARSLAQESNLPPYSADAGKGYALIAGHRPETEKAFLTACNEIAGARKLAEVAEMKWRKRLDSIFALKGRVLDLTTKED